MCALHWGRPTAMRKVGTSEATSAPVLTHADNERDADLVGLWWQAYRRASSQLPGDAAAPAATVVTAPAAEAARSVATSPGSELQWLSVPVLVQAE